MLIIKRNVLLSTRNAHLYKKVITNSFELYQVTAKSSRTQLLTFTDNNQGNKRYQQNPFPSLLSRHSKVLFFYIKIFNKSLKFNIYIQI